MAGKSNCDTCSNYLWDEDLEGYVCDVNMDEDDMAHQILHAHTDCPYYRSDNEYEVVRHQM